MHGAQVPKCLSLAAAWSRAAVRPRSPPQPRFNKVIAAAEEAAKGDEWVDVQDFDECDDAEAEAAAQVLAQM